MVELSTTVYVVPLITSVSPTVALGHSHVPSTNEIDEATAAALTVIVPVTTCDVEAPVKASV